MTRLSHAGGMKVGEAGSALRFFLFVECLPAFFMHCTNTLSLSLSLGTFVAKQPLAYEVHTCGKHRN